jgi:uncharacterized protein YbjT (DUF2867 family)
VKIAVAGGTGTVGAHVVASLGAAGHETVVLSRAAGIDLTTGFGLVDALRGVDAVVDASGPAGTSAEKSKQFFRTVTRNLLDAENEAGIRHHVALSIIGAAAVNAGYYAGKRIQEDLVTASESNWTILRAAQFFEFAPMLVRTAKAGPFVLVPRMNCQPIAASEVGAVLAKLAEGKPRGIVPDLAGPKLENMADMVRRYLAETGTAGRVVEIAPPGRWWHALWDGSILPAADAQLGTLTYAEWLATL